MVRPRHAGILFSVNTKAMWIALAYLLLVAIALAGAFLLLRSTRGPRKPALDSERVERAENGWFVLVAVSLIVLLLVTYDSVPWRAEAQGDRQIVTVTGQQFGFTFDPPGPYRAGHQIEFRLTSKDVNHAFALFSPRGALIDQAQMLPGKTVRLLVTLLRPGTYSVRCFEFCGIGHAEMEAKIVVRP